MPQPWDLVCKPICETDYHVRTGRGAGDAEVPTPLPQALPALQRESTGTDLNRVLRVMQQFFSEAHDNRERMEQRMTSRQERMEQSLQAQLKSLDSRFENLRSQMEAGPSPLSLAFSKAGQSPLPSPRSNGDRRASGNGIETAMEGAKVNSDATNGNGRTSFLSTGSRGTGRSSLRSGTKRTRPAPDAKKSKSQIRDREPTDVFERIVANRHFDSLCAFVVVCNSLLVGLQINHEAVSDAAMPAYEVIEYVCTAFFTAELFLRMLARKRDFCNREERHWALFDVVLVSMSWIDILMKIAMEASGGMPGPGASIAKILKMARMARIMRIVRMVRFLTKIRIMTQMIVGSMMSLFWLLVLLLSVMYIFAIVLTQGATMWLKPDDLDPPVGDAKFEKVKDYFGSLPRTVYTLFSAMTGGVSWGDPADMSQALGVAYFLVFTFFIFFTVFSVMNIVTGVFVDGAIQQANGDRNSVIEKQMKYKEEMKQSLEELLMELDADESGIVCHDEWETNFHDERLQAALRGLEVDVHEPEVLWDLLDANGDNELDIREFVDGMMRLKGPAKAIDMHHMLLRIHSISNQTMSVQRRMEDLLKLCGIQRLSVSDVSSLATTAMSKPAAKQ